jgi:tetratricopeptide (TPR) repeat protein
MLLAEDSSIEQTEQRLAAARQNGNRAEEMSALTDLGLLAQLHGEFSQAVAYLDEALLLARSLGDKASEGDILGSLGFTLQTANRPEPACPYLEQALIMARAAGDRFAEKLTLERLAMVRAMLGDLPAALGLLNEALPLARTLGDRQHEADLLWHLALRLAESGEREQALSLGQEAVHLLKKLGKPQATVYAEHLEKYRLAAAQAGGSEALGQVGAWSFVTTVIVEQVVDTPMVPSLPPAPSYLRMAISAGQALLRFVGSGLKTVPAETFPERLRLCAACSYHTGLRCRICGCFTNLKARLPHEECPIGQWQSLTSSQMCGSLSQDA